MFKSGNEGTTDHEADTNELVPASLRLRYRLLEGFLAPAMTEDAADDPVVDNSEWHGNRFPAWDSDESALRAARNEARESLVETIDAIRRIDESATKTLRIDVVILGLTSTAGSSLGFTTRFVNELTVLGVITVGVSTVFAVATMLGSDYPTGVSEDYLKDFQQASWSEREWNEWMLREYSKWLSEANEMADADARVLLYSRVCLGIGLFALLLGITSGATGLVGPLLWPGELQTSFRDYF